MVKNLQERFMKKNCSIKANQAEIGIEKVMTKRMINYLLSGHYYIIMISLYEISYHPKVDNHIRNKIKVEMRHN